MMEVENEEDDRGDTDEDEEERREAEEAFYQQIYYRTYHSSPCITGNTREIAKDSEKILPESSLHREDDSKQHENESWVKNALNRSLLLKLGHSDNSESSTDEDSRDERLKDWQNDIVVIAGQYIEGENLRGKKSLLRGLDDQYQTERLRGISRLRQSEIESVREKNVKPNICIAKNGFHSDDEDDSGIKLCGSQGSDDVVLIVSSDTDVDQYCEIVDDNLADIFEVLNDGPVIDDSVIEDSVIEDFVIEEPVNEVKEKSIPPSSLANRRLKSDLNRTRYFTVQEDMKCTNCFALDHVKDTCPEDEKPPMCVLCGIQGHVSYTCPDKLCFNCDRPGHQSKDCPYPSQRPHHQCSRCKMFGHLKEMCPDQWRQYHMTTKDGDLVVADKPDFKVLRMYCYNCGEKGHLGHMCKEPMMSLPRGEKISLRSMPIVCQYKKLRYPKPSAATISGSDNEGVEREEEVYVVSPTKFSSENGDIMHGNRQKKRKRNSGQPVGGFVLPSHYQTKNNHKSLQKLERGSNNVSVYCTLGHTPNEPCGGSDRITVSRPCDNRSRRLSVMNNGPKKGTKTYFNSGQQATSQKRKASNFSLLMVGVKNKGKRRKVKNNDVCGADTNGLLEEPPPLHSLAMKDGVTGHHDGTRSAAAKGTKSSRRRKRKTNARNLRMNRSGQDQARETSGNTSTILGKTKEIVVNFNSNGERRVLLD